ncbi:MAG: cytidylate kinase-like family protein [Treponemataceae bacterium]|nr:cytidylate kinase-like family protein [Treponemataceae bacterium]
MAIIAISRQVAALGDEVAQELSKQTGYKFVDRKNIEKRIIELGFPEDKMKKYDERKPGFFASLAKNRDEYLDYLQTAVLEAASEGNCILIGRGAFIVLESVPNLISVRFVARDDVRIKRLMDEFNWTEKQALMRIEESDSNRLGFHKSFFNLINEDPSHFHLTLNTGILNVKEAASIIDCLRKTLITPEKEKLGEEKIKSLFEAQRLVNKLIFDHKLNIIFLKAVVNGDVVVLHGVTDSAAVAEKAVTISTELMKGKKIESCISIVQDYKAYP